MPLTQPIRHRGWTFATFSPEAHRVLTASAESTARLWDAVTGEALMAPIQHAGIVWSAQMSPDGLFAITASADKTAQVWDVRLGDLRSLTLHHHGPVWDAQFSPDGEWVVTASEDGSARIWNSRTGEPRGSELTHSSWVRAVLFSPQGERIATGSGDHTARIWDSRNGQPVTPFLNHGAPVSLVQFSPDGETLATASEWDGLVRLWNARTGQPRGDPFRHSSSVRVLSFSPDGRRLLTDDFQSDFAQIRDADSGRLLLELRGHEGYVVYAEFSPDGDRVVTASEDGTARLWHAHTGKLLTEPLRHKSWVSCARFSRDGRRVVTASGDGTAQVWDPASGHPVGEPLRHRDEVKAAEFSPDGMLVVTASTEGTMRLWDATTGRPVTEPFRHLRSVVSARFSPDGRRVLTASLAGSAHLWDVPPMIQDADSILADLAETVIGKSVSAHGALESVSPARLGELRARLAGLPSESEFTRWLEWLLADRSTRSISPCSPITVSAYVQSRATDTNETSWREALMLCPTNGIAFAQMAQHYAEQSQSSDSLADARAAWASSQAIKFAPWDSKAWYYRRKALERSGDWTRLLADADQAIQAQPTNACAWAAKAHALEALEKFAAMLTACNHAMESWQADPNIQWDLPLRSDILRRRSLAFRRLGKLSEAAADNTAAYGLAARDSEAGLNLIDLGAFYNGGATEEFPGGIAHLGGTDFDFRGWIHLDPGQALPQAPPLPKRIDGIPIQRQCRHLHFLHTVGAASRISPMANGGREEKLNVPLGTAVGHYIIHYTDGEHVEIPIVHGRDMRDYWFFPEYSTGNPDLISAWTGSSQSSRREGATTRLFKSSWVNPRPDVPIDTLDFVHADTHAAPILVAITAE
jgi:WD40 repeat protein/tetratricopeptide (TPR) repeat protein